jgi:hypothetical protein
VAKHAIFIKGVNTEIGTKQAERNVKKVFEQRFGKGEIISAHAYKKSVQAQKVYKQIKAFKEKVDELKQ